MHIHRCRTLLTVCFACISLVCPAAASAQDVALDIPEIILRNTSRVAFTVNPSASPIAGDDLKDVVTVQTEQHRYRVRVPITQISWFNAQQSFSYTFIVDDSRTGRRHLFDVFAMPAGSFDEQIASVPFTIRAAADEEKGIVKLPIASLRRETAALALSGRSQRALAFWGEQIVKMEVKNTSELFPIIVNLDEAASVEVGALFEGTGRIVKPVHRRVTIKPQQTVTFEVLVKPKWSDALTELILPRAAEEDKKLTLNLDHQVGPFGDHPISLFSQKLDISFQPKPGDLLIALLFGVLLGLVFRYVNMPAPHATKTAQTSRARFTILLKVVLVAVIGAIALEIVAIFLRGAGNRLILFGFEMDPNAVVPTLVIGATSGYLGKALGEYVRTKISKLTPFGADVKPV